MEPIDEAFRSHIVNLMEDASSESAIAGQVGTKVFGGHEEPVGLPLVNFYHIATLDLPGETLDGGDGLARIIVETSFKADKKQEVQDLMNIFLDDWKPKKNGLSRRTIGTDYTVRVDYASITTRQMIFDSDRECFHGIVDLMIIYREG